MRYKLDNLDQSIELINFDEVDDLLIKEFQNFSVEFFFEFGVFLGHRFEVVGQKVHQSFGPHILHWHLHCFVGVNLQEGEVVDSDGFDVAASESFSDG